MGLGMSLIIGMSISFFFTMIFFSVLNIFRKKDIVDNLHLASIFYIVYGVLMTIILFFGWY